MRYNLLILFITSFFLASAQELIDTTYSINNVKISVADKPLNNEFLSLNITTGNETLLFDTLEQWNSIAYIELTNFDSDQFPDLMVCYLGNNPFYILYIFDSNTQKFRKIADYHNFPDSKQLTTEPNFYFSYHRAGCADLNWVSDLFKLENFRIHHLGHIYGQGCDADIEHEPQQIEIFDVTLAGENKLRETLNYLPNINEHSDKWEFIKKYWNEYAKKFK